MSKAPAMKPFATTWLIYLLDWWSWRRRWRKWQNGATTKPPRTRASGDLFVGATVIKVWFPAIWIRARYQPVLALRWLDCQRLNGIECEQANSRSLVGRWISLNGLDSQLTTCPLLYHLVLGHWDVLFHQSSTTVRNILGLGVKCNLAYRKDFPRPTGYSLRLFRRII